MRVLSHALRRAAQSPHQQVRQRLLSSASAAKPHATLVLVRHGQSEWNLANLFTGWVDVPLTPKGIEEASEGGRLLALENVCFKRAYTSRLKRAIKTLHLVLEELDMLHLDVFKHWRLNERHYGALAGLDKAETVQKYGETQVMEWRRSYATPPPEVSLDSEFYPGNDKRYADIPPEELPRAESLKSTLDRLIPWYKAEIEPQLINGDNILITAHGNSLRALVKYLDDVDEDSILGVNIPTGVPLLYQLDSSGKPIKQKGSVAPLQGRYLGDASAVAAAAAAVANQTAAKK